MERLFESAGLFNNFRSRKTIDAQRNNFKSYMTQAVMSLSFPCGLYQEHIMIILLHLLKIFCLATKGNIGIPWIGNNKYLSILVFRNLLNMVDRIVEVRITRYVGLPVSKSIPFFYCKNSGSRNRTRNIVSVRK